jgi:E3 ubiquitin-protein ligase listerin
LAVTFYEPNDSDEPLEQILNLATHLYYLSLLHLSSLSRAWFVEIRSRGLSQGVEAFTEKHITPHVIESALKSVQLWSETQTADSADDKPMNIKAYIPLGEVIASYTIATVEVADPTNHGFVDTEFDVAICVKLPKAFPLRTVEVKSVTARSTFDERRWTAWLRTCQGIISHRNEGLVDGLLSWKRNVVGAVQGKSECAICYSLVAEDGKLPSKKCKTCKNTFHSWCLNKWFTSSGKRECPLCRSDFDVRKG